MPRKRLITFTQEIECQEDLTKQGVFFVKKKKIPKVLFHVNHVLVFLYLFIFLGQEATDIGGRCLHM